MSEPDPPNRTERLRARVRQLILMRETGPKRSAWHHARVRLIWRLHSELRATDASSNERATADGEMGRREDGVTRREGDKETG